MSNLIPQRQLLAVVTCGPGVCPVDEVRQITNFSSGELGVLLTEALLRAGWEVFCVKSAAATHRDPLCMEAGRLHIHQFSTNDSLLRTLSEEIPRESVGCLFHAAALNDYQVKSIRSEEGRELFGRKISSSHSRLIVELVPAAKILPLLGGLFPIARVVGWKYELDDGREAALAKGFEQVRKQGTALCIVNGRAVGGQFCVVNDTNILAELPDKGVLCEWLTNWAARAD